MRSSVSSISSSLGVVAISGCWATDGDVALVVEALGTELAQPIVDCHIPRQSKVRLDRQEWMFADGTLVAYFRLRGECVPLLDDVYGPECVPTTQDQPLIQRRCERSNAQTSARGRGSRGQVHRIGETEVVVVGEVNPTGPP